MVMKTPDERAMEIPRKRVKREFRFLLITFKLARQYGLWGFGYDYKCWIFKEHVIPDWQRAIIEKWFTCPTLTREVKGILEYSKSTHIYVHIMCTCSNIKRISRSYLIYARCVRKGAIIGLPWPFWMSWNVFHFSHHPLKITGALKLVSKDDLLKWLDTLLSAVPTALLQPGIHLVLTSPLLTYSPLPTSSLHIERWTSAKQRCSAVSWNLATMVTCWSRWTRC